MQVYPRISTCVVDTLQMSWRCRFVRRYHSVMCADLCKGNESDMTMISLTQSWFLIAWYEASQNYLPRAWFSVGRAVKLAQFQNLHIIDHTNMGVALAIDRKTVSDREERRRTFWAVYQADTWSCAMANRTAAFHDDNVSLLNQTARSYLMMFTRSLPVYHVLRLHTRMIFWNSPPFRKMSSPVGVLQACHYSQRHHSRVPSCRDANE
jgi:hypothetical protein